MIVPHYIWWIPSPALEDLPESRSLHLQSPPDSGPHATRFDAGLQRRHMGWIQIRHRRGIRVNPKKAGVLLGAGAVDAGVWCGSNMEVGFRITDFWWSNIFQEGWWGNMCKNLFICNWSVANSRIFKEGNLRICKVLDKIQVCWVKRSWLFHIESLSPHCLLVCWERKAAIGEDQQAVENIWWNR